MPSKKVKKKKPLKTWRIVIEKICNVIETSTYEGVKAATEAEAIAKVEKWDETGEVQPDDMDENIEFDYQNVHAYLMRKKKGIYEWLFKGRKT